MQKSDQNTLKSALAAASGRPAGAEFDRAAPLPGPAAGPFDLSSSTEYQTWRTDKLAGLPEHSHALMVRVNDLAAPTGSEIDGIIRICRRNNMAIYEARSGKITADSIRRFAAYFGLTRLDRHLLSGDGGVAALEAAAAGQRQSYIPYTRRRLGWHTDGYYNDSDHLIGAVVLHCARPAASGGENAMLDPEIAYIRLRDENPDFITALMHPRCMTIPANRGQGQGESGEIRPARRGPVFSLGPGTGALYMRFTARKRSIEWRQDKTTRDAVDFLLALLESSDGPVIRHRLEAGQGLISNNVLHNRTAFEDDPAAPRLIYRARFLDRIK